MEFIFWSIAVFVILVTAAPWLRTDAYWVRVWDFPRGQLAVLGSIAAVGLFFQAGSGWLATLVWALLVSAIAYQIAKMLPYTLVSERQVQSAKTPDNNSKIKLVSANVYQPNTNAKGLLDIVRNVQPDVFLAVETNRWWVEKLSELDSEYPYSVKHPLGNTYGMALFSRFELVDPELQYVVEEKIPSITTGVRLPSGEVIRLVCLHPRPPGHELRNSTQRDAELVVVGRRIAEMEEHQPIVVVGDLNDVAWSYTTTLFQRISGLLDPRIGRGMFNTFDAKNPLLRYPVDHVFHSDDFRLIEMKRLPKYGSDHFPILAHLSLEHDAEAVQEVEPPDDEDEENADEMVERAEEAGFSGVKSPSQPNRAQG